MVSGIVVGGMLALWAWDARPAQPVLPVASPWQRVSWTERPTCARQNVTEAVSAALAARALPSEPDSFATTDLDRAAVESAPTSEPATAAPASQPGSAAPAGAPAPRLVSGDRVTRTVRVQGTRPKPAPPPVPGRYALGPADVAQQIANFEDVLRSVQALPGVSSASDLHGDFFVRGSGSNANSIWLDGIEIAFPYHILGFNSIFNPGMLADGEFWSGGAPVRFGNATGGVLSLRSRGAVEEPPAAVVGLSALSAQAHGAWGGARWGGAVSLRRSYHDKLLILLGTPAGREVPTFHDLFVRARLQVSSRHRFTASLLHAGDGLMLPRPEVRASDFDFLVLDESERDRAASEIQRFNALNDRLTLENRIAVATLGWSVVTGGRSYLETTLGFVPTNFEFGLRGDNRESVSIRATSLTLRQDLAWQPGRHRVGAGWLASRDVADRRVSAWSGILHLRESNSAINLADIDERVELTAVRRRTTFAAYADDEIGWRGDRLRLGAGLRAEHDGWAQQTLLSPRLSATVAEGGRTWRATAGVAHAMHDRAMDVQPTADGTALRAERAIEATFGCGTSIAAGLDVGATLYAKRLEDLVYEPSPAVYASGGEGRSYGLELQARFAPRRAPVRASLAYTCSETRQRDPKAWRRRPNYHATTIDDFWGAVEEAPYWYHPFQDERHRLGVEASVDFRRWSLGARYQFGSGRPYTPVQFVATDPIGIRYGIVGDLGSARYPYTQRLDVRAQRTWKRGRIGWNVYADVLNVTGADNVYSYRYNPSYTLRYAVKMLPTLPTLGVEARF